MFKHTYVQINYTTYDLWREQDSIGPYSHPNIMLLSQEDKRLHPYLYTHVCLIFHVMVQHCKDTVSLCIFQPKTDGHLVCPLVPM